MMNLVGTVEQKALVLDVEIASDQLHGRMFVVLRNCEGLFAKMETKEAFADACSFCYAELTQLFALTWSGQHRFFIQYDPKDDVCSVDVFYNVTLYNGVTLKDIREEQSEISDIILNAFENFSGTAFQVEFIAVNSLGN